jgi:hypothetical protein
MNLNSIYKNHLEAHKMAEFSIKEIKHILIMGMGTNNQTTRLPMLIIVHRENLILIYI